MWSVSSMWSTMSLPLGLWYFWRRIVVKLYQFQANFITGTIGRYNCEKKGEFAHTIVWQILRSFGGTPREAVPLSFFQPEKIPNSPFAHNLQSAKHRRRLNKLIVSRECAAHSSVDGLGTFAYPCLIQSGSNKLQTAGFQHREPACQ